MKYVVLIAAISLVASQATAQQCCIPAPTPKLQVIYKTKVVEKPVYIQQPALVTPCCDKDKGRTDANADNDTRVQTGSQKAQTGNQKVIINMPQQPPTRIIVRERVRTQVKREIKEVEVFKPNRLQLLLGLSKTKLEVEQDECCNFRAKRVYEPDVGLQYLRDFDSFTGSIGGTVNQNVYVGLGFNW